MRGVAQPTEEFLAELGERFERIQVACSFQKEAVVIAHLVSETLPQARPVDELAVIRFRSAGDEPFG